MEMVRTLHLIAQKPGLRLDKYLCQELGGVSRSYIQKLISSGYITVNGIKAKASLKLNRGDRVVATLPPPPPSPLTPEEMPLAIVYEDNDLIVVDKPAGLAVHPAPGHPSHTLVNAILAHCPQLASVGGSLRPGIVHRLDKDTSGLMLIAKNDRARLKLQSQIKERSILKRYLVLARGRLAPERGTIEAPIGRDPRNRKRMAIVAAGREAITHYRVLRYLNNYTLLEVTPETGRTHQIRVHLSAIGYPVVGDALYGAKSPFLGRQFVHASYLRFEHPSSGRVVEFTSELPPDLEDALANIK